MDSLQTFFVLLSISTLLVAASQRIKVAYPIVLVLAGAILGFIPGLTTIDLDPHLLLVLVLPPILHYAAYGISFRDFKKYWGDIFSLALGLVLVTTFVVGVLFKWMFPALPWAAAFAFGAIVSPPDAIAATTILKRFPISPRLSAILEGESLINDASALVLYKLAVIAVLSGTFSLGEGVIDFIQNVLGGTAIGIIMGLCLQLFSKNYLEPIVGVIFSFSIPYLTFLLADALDVSGVLAVVTAGLIGSRLLVTHTSSLRRVVGFATWDIFIILLNCFVFVLIGLELYSIIQVLSLEDLLLYSFYSLVITFAMIAIRIAWVYARGTIKYFIAAHKPHATTICPQIVHNTVIIGWSGMRGIVSLTAALALPFAFPGRNIVIFMTFMVILLTLLIPGLTLDPLIRWLDIRYQPEHPDTHRVLKQLAKTAEEKLKRLHDTNKMSDDELEFLQTYFRQQRPLLDFAIHGHKRMSNLSDIRLQVLQKQRKELLEMWESGDIDDQLLRLIEHQLDIEESHLTRAQLS